MKAQAKDLATPRAPRRRIDAGEAGKMAGVMIGRVIAGERKRYRRHFAALWFAWAALALYAVLA